MAINVLLWVVQGLLAALFLFAGGMKLVLPLEALAGPIALPGLFMRFIGVAEVAGALGLVLPSLLRIQPRLTPVAAGRLVIIMIGATTLTILPEALRTFDQQFPGLRMVIYALLLILLMIFRPQGLFGRRELDWSWFRTPGRRPAVNGGAR